MSDRAKAAFSGDSFSGRFTTGSATYSGRLAWRMTRPRCPAEDASVAFVSVATCSATADETCSGNASPFVPSPSSSTWLLVGPRWYCSITVRVPFQRSLNEASAADEDADEVRARYSGLAL